MVLLLHMNGLKDGQVDGWINERSWVPLLLPSEQTSQTAKFLPVLYAYLGLEDAQPSGRCPGKQINTNLQLFSMIYTVLH